MGAKAICYLSRGESGRADRVVFNLNGYNPTMKYTGKNKPSKKQLAAGELASQKRRCLDMDLNIKRTKKRSPDP